MSVSHRNARSDDSKILSKCAVQNCGLAGAGV